MRLSFNFAAVAAVVLAVCCGDAKANIFEPLFTVTDLVGDVKIFKPGNTTPEQVKESHAYPYGSRILVGKWNGKEKSPKPEVNFSLSPDHKFKLEAGSDLTILEGSDEAIPQKVFDLATGTLKTFISISTVKTGGAEDVQVEAAINAVSVKTPLADCFKLTERNEISVETDGENHTVFFASESGMMQVTGPQFAISSMQRHARVEIFGNKDFTRITDVLGEFTGTIEKGADASEVVAFKLHSVVKIWRRYAEIGGRMAVSVMTVYPDGAIKSYAYLEGEKAVFDSSVSFSDKGPKDVEKTKIPSQDSVASEPDAFASPSDPATEVAVPAEKPAETATDSFEGFNFDW